MFSNAVDTGQIITWLRYYSRSAPRFVTGKGNFSKISWFLLAQPLLLKLGDLSGGVAMARCNEPHHSCLQHGKCQKALFLLHSFSHNVLDTLSAQANDKEKMMGRNRAQPL